MKIGLSLGGGGARGSYQIGCFKALEEIGILNKITHLSGTSIGSLNALLLASNKTHEEQKLIWSKLLNKKIFSQKRKEGIGIFSTSPIYDELSLYINNEDIKESKIKTYVTLAKINGKDKVLKQLSKKQQTIEYVYLNNNENVFDVVLASCAIPIIFGSKKINESYYVDGGTLNNYPLEPLINDGVKFIISIPLDRFYKVKKHQDEKVNIIDLGAISTYGRIFFIDIIETIFFTKKRINKRYLYGYLLTKMMIEKAIKNNYLRKDFSPIITDEYRFLKISKSEDKQLKKEVKRKIKSGFTFM